jgi:hypothetical protein
MNKKRIFLAILAVGSLQMQQTLPVSGLSTAIKTYYKPVIGVMAFCGLAGSYAMYRCCQLQRVFDVGESKPVASVSNGILPEGPSQLSHVVIEQNPVVQPKVVKQVCALDVDLPKSSASVSNGISQEVLDLAPRPVVQQRVVIQQKIKQVCADTFCQKCGVTYEDEMSWGAHVCPTGILRSNTLCKTCGGGYISSNNQLFYGCPHCKAGCPHTRK